MGAEASLTQSVGDEEALARLRAFAAHLPAEVKAAPISDDVALTGDELNLLDAEPGDADLSFCPAHDLGPTAVKAGACSGPGACDTSPVGTPGGKQNWLDKVNGLPPYIRAIAHALIRNGKDESSAIAIAVGTVKKWAAGGGKVSAATKARAAAAVAAWEAKKAASGKKGLGAASLDLAAGEWVPGLTEKEESVGSVKANEPTDGLEFKEAKVSLVTVEDEQKGIVSALVSVTGIVDRVNDIIEPGAYAKSLAERTPKGVWSHDWDKPVSKTLECRELLPSDPMLKGLKLRNGSPWPTNAGALYVKTQFNLTGDRGRQAFADVVFFDTEQEWSIGYNVPVGGSKIEPGSGVRRIKQIDLFEYSPVLFGAMPSALTLSVKSAQSAFAAMGRIAPEELERSAEIKAAFTKSSTSAVAALSTDQTAAFAAAKAAAAKSGDPAPVIDSDGRLDGAMPVVRESLKSESAAPATSASGAAAVYFDGDQKVYSDGTVIDGKGVQPLKVSSAMVDVMKDTAGSKAFPKPAAPVAPAAEAAKPAEPTDTTGALQLEPPPIAATPPHAQTAAEAADAAPTVLLDAVPTGRLKSEQDAPMHTTAGGLLLTVVDGTAVYDDGGLHDGQGWMKQKLDPKVVKRVCDARNTMRESLGMAELPLSDYALGKVDATVPAPASTPVTSDQQGAKPASVATDAAPTPAAKKPEQAAPVAVATSDSATAETASAAPAAVPVAKKSDAPTGSDGIPSSEDLAAAVDAVVDVAVSLIGANDPTALPVWAQQLCYLVLSADGTIDDLLVSMDVPDPDSDDDAGDETKEAPGKVGAHRFAPSKGKCAVCGMGFAGHMAAMRKLKSEKGGTVKALQGAIDSLGGVEAKAAGFAPCPTCKGTDRDEFADGSARCEVDGSALTPIEAKAGRVLSGVNASALQRAYQTLGDLLRKAGVLGDDVDPTATSGAGEEQKSLYADWLEDPTGASSAPEPTVVPVEVPATREVSVEVQPEPVVEQKSLIGRISEQEVLRARRLALMTDYTG